MTRPTLDLVIVNWNTGPLLKACLESIAQAAQETGEIKRVVVVDNASSDRSAEELDGFSLPLELIRNEGNRGFAAACNQGASGSEADYLLFLNPDTRLFADSLDGPVRFLEDPEHKHVGICGIQLVDEAGVISRSCANFPQPIHFFGKMLGLGKLLPGRFPTHAMVDWDHATSAEVDQVIGAFFMIRRPLFVALNGFDERFFVYFEEVDLAFRARQAGWASYYLANVQAFHRGCGSTDQVRAARLFYSLRSRILYGYKHYGRLPATALALGTLGLEFLARAGGALLRRDFTSLKETAQGYRRLWGESRRLLSGR